MKLKNSLFTFSLLLLTGLSLSAQDFNKIYTGSVSFIGIDYTLSKLVPDEEGEGFTDIEKIKNTYVPAWNDKMYEEKDKYEFKEMLRIEEMSYNMDYIKKYNQDNIGIQSWDEGGRSYSLSEGEVKKHIKKLDLSSIETDYAILLVCEKLDKGGEVGHFYFTCIDVKTGKVFKIKKYVTEAGGFGFRNYWLRPIYEIVKDLKKDSKNWRKGK